MPNVEYARCIEQCVGLPDIDAWQSGIEVTNQTIRWWLTSPCPVGMSSFVVL
jgi:hypothetical protein